MLHRDQSPFSILDESTPSCAVIPAPAINFAAGWLDLHGCVCLKALKTKHNYEYEF
jgi:hypothetical protein